MAVKKTATDTAENYGLKAAQFIKELCALEKEQVAVNAKYFSKTDKTNMILGVRMSAIFTIAKKYMHMSLVEINELLENKYYEVGMGAISIMDFRARDKKITHDNKKALFNLYINQHENINNWDLVDRGAPYIVGGYLYDKPRRILYKLARSKNIWERRTSIVATYYFIRKGETADTFSIAGLLVNDKEDLINKAVGSWIREAGKYNPEKLLAFLDKYAATMPRVTLRYAIEKLDRTRKNEYVKMNVNYEKK